MTVNLLGRALGAVSPQALQQAETSQLLYALQLAPDIKFDGSDGPSISARAAGDQPQEDAPVWAHKAGVNCLTVDPFEGRYMVSGGADASLLLWDLESVEDTSKRFTYKPAARTSKSAATHKFGITHLSFYPFDSLAFLSSSYDHSLKICTTETLAPSASFDLDSVVYSHAISSIANHLLVACATQHSAIRLIDLRSGAKAHSLAGHQGAVLAVAWSPKDEYTLASGGSDGTVRIFDVRRSSSLGVLDLEDSVGVHGEDGFGSSARPKHQGRAHNGVCNGVVWTSDGNFIVSTGHDERLRVFNVGVGANVLSYFGPIIKNTHHSTVFPMIVPHVKNTILYPNEKEILMLDMFEGTLLKRLRVPGASMNQARSTGGQRNIKNRITSLTWRLGDFMYSAYSDGTIRGWRPTSQVEGDLDKEGEAGFDDGEDEGRKRKRQALDEVFRDLTKQKITFT